MVDIFNKNILKEDLIVHSKITRAIKKVEFNGEMYALKKVKKGGMNAEVERNQIEILRTLQRNDDLSNFIIKFYNNFETRKNLYFVFELIEGTPYKHLLKLRKDMEGKRFTEQTSKFFSMQIILAIEHLHTYDAAHRDVKPENILVKKDGYLKLADFGYSRIITTKGRYAQCGTTEYLAPEILKGDEYDKSVDWWSVGVFIFEAVDGRSPFKYISKNDMEESIKLVRYKFRGDPSQSCKVLISKFLEEEPAKRLGNLANKAEDIKREKWF